MKPSRLIPLLVIPIAVTFSLSGCLAGLIAQPSAPIAVPTFDQETEPPFPEDTDIPVPDDTVVPDDTAAPSDTAAPATPTDASVAAPGTTAGLGESLAYNYTGTDDVKAVISAKLLDVTPATDEQMVYLNQAFDKDELKGYNVVLIHVEETKVSGDPVEFNSDWSGYSPIDADGNQAQDVTVIGWDECSVESFTEEFDNGDPLTQCFIAAYPDGGNPVAGVWYAGGFEDGNPYDAYDGKPLLFIGS